MANSTRKSRTSKVPAKPYDGFPLFPHATGRWAKKVRGKLVYFGKITDDLHGERALEKWNAEQADLLAGRTPKSRRKGVKSNTRKVSKPSKDFPLFPHQSGRWAKKIRQRFHYFGKIEDDPDGVEALKLWIEQRDDLLAGRVPRNRDGVTIGDLCNAFLDAKELLLDSGELSPRSFRDYHRVATIVIDYFGKSRLIDDLRPDDFGRLRAHLAKTRGPVTLGNEIARIRIIFKFAVDSDLTERAVKFGQSFAKPSRKTIRKAKASNGRRTFEAAELRKIIDAAKVPMKAFILLAINGGLGQSDIAELPIEAIDLRGGWLNYPRPKTGVDRRIPLWPETVKAVKAALAVRPKAEDTTDDGLAFLTLTGRRWVRVRKSDKGTFVPIDALQQEFRKLLDDVAGIRRLTFYALRHTHRTVSDGAKDQPAANAIMGHVAAANDMSAVYRESIEDDRLRAVVDHVKAWLWPPKPKATKKVAKKPRAK